MAFEASVIAPTTTISVAIDVTPSRTPGIPVPVPARIISPAFPPVGIVLTAPAATVAAVIPAEPFTRVPEPPAPPPPVAEGLVAVAESPASRVVAIPVITGEPGLTGVVATLMPVGAFHAARDLVAPGARLGVADSSGFAGFVAAGCALGGGPTSLRGTVRLVRLGFLLGHGHVRSSNVLVSGPAERSAGCGSSRPIREALNTRRPLALDARC